MKRGLCIIFIFFLTGIAGRSLPSPQETVSVQNVSGQSLQDEETYIPYYDQGILPTHLYQKSLPPMPHREKVIWAFRTARTNIFQ